MAAVLSYAEFMGGGGAPAAPQQLAPINDTNGNWIGYSAPAGGQPPAAPAASGFIRYEDFMRGAPAASSPTPAPAEPASSPVIGGVPMLPGGLDTGTAGTLDYGPQGSPGAQNFGAGLERTLRDATDRPAEFLARNLGGAAEGDRIAQGDTATREQFEAGPGQTWAGTGGRLLGQLALTAPLIASGAGLAGAGADALGAAVPAVGNAGRAIAAVPGAGYVGGVLGAAGGGAAAAGLIAGQSDQPIGQQMVTGGLLGGALGALAPAVTGAASKVGGLFRPLTQDGREVLAAQKLADAASDLPAVRAALQNPVELVPGSVPTTFQATGDAGLGRLERSVAANHSDAFLARQGAQSDARQAVLQQLAPAGANPAAVGSAFRDHLDALDQHAGSAAAAMGGVPAPGTAGTAAQSYGQAIRGGLASSNLAAKQAEGALYRAIDPQGNLAVNMVPIRETAQTVRAAMPANAAPMTGPEAQIFGVASTLPARQPFAELQALRTRIGDAARQELSTNGATPTYARLNQLRQATHDAMQASVEGRAAQDAQAVAAGQMAPEQSLQARMQGVVNDWRAARAAQAGGDNGAGAGGIGGTGSASGPGLSGTASPAVVRPGTVAGSKSVSAGTRPLVDFDQAAASRYAAARAATVARKTTFDNAPGVGAVLKPGQTASSFAMADERVPSALFGKGADAATRAQAFQRAAQDSPEARAALSDYAAFSYRQSAMPHGEFDPAASVRWMAQHQDALRSFPDVAQRIAATQRTATEKMAFVKSPAGQFLSRDGDPVATLGRIMTSDRAPQHMADLAALTAGNPAARAGLQRAAADHMASVMTNPYSGATQRAAFNKLAGQSVEALRPIFSDAQIQSIRAIAADLRRSDPALTKLPGGSNTAQDTSAMKQHGHDDHSGLGTLIGYELAEQAGEHAFGATLGWLAGPAAFLVKTMHAVGMKAVSDVVTEAMLNPALAQRLLTKLTPENAPTIMHSAAAILRAGATRATANELNRSQSSGGPGAGAAQMLGAGAPTLRPTMPVPAQQRAALVPATVRPGQLTLAQPQAIQGRPAGILAGFTQQRLAQMGQPAPGGMLNSVTQPGSSGPLRHGALARAIGMPRGMTRFA